MSEHGGSPLLSLLHRPGRDVLGRLGHRALLGQGGDEGAVGLQTVVRHLTASLPPGPRARPPSDSDPHWRPSSPGHVLDRALDVGGVVQVYLLHVGLDLGHFALKYYQSMLYSGLYSDRSSYICAEILL